MCSRDSNLSPPAEGTPISATIETEIARFQQGKFSFESDLLIQEVPVALVYNGISHAVMLATPANLEDFALGFSLSENVLSQPSELYDFEIIHEPNGIVIDMHIDSARFSMLKTFRRSRLGRSGCGLCGIESLASLAYSSSTITLNQTFLLMPRAIEQALKAFSSLQSLRSSTGAAHGAAWVSADGTIFCLREDVWRHNALDKVLGAVASSKQSLQEGFVMVSSRASYEMVLKAAMLGVNTLVAMSAPTSLAVKLAAERGVLLVGFARIDKWVAYTFPERFSCFEKTISINDRPI